MYAFKGVGPSGKTVSGVRDAESPKLLRQLLRKDGVLVTSFELSRGGKAARDQNAQKGGLSKDVDLGGLLGGVKKVEIAAFTRQIATLLKAGIPLAEALGVLVEQTENVRLKTPVSEVRAGSVAHRFDTPFGKDLEIYDYPGDYAERFDGVNRGGGDDSAKLQGVFKDNQRTVDVRMQQEALPGLVIRGRPHAGSSSLATSSRWKCRTRAGRRVGNRTASSWSSPANSTRT